mmetsp:Transcript_26510/g.76521  ORF Transcript_26510/g.76521 Transcript_26510/m.76521 type:complete len:201 (+) Transcript_26510:1625-2227(+)
MDRFVRAIERCNVKQSLASFHNRIRSRTTITFIGMCARCFLGFLSGSLIHPRTPTKEHLQSLVPMKAVVQNDLERWRTCIASALSSKRDAATAAGIAIGIVVVVVVVVLFPLIPSVPGNGLLYFLVFVGSIITTGGVLGVVFDGRPSRHEGIDHHAMAQYVPDANIVQEAAEEGGIVPNHGPMDRRIDGGWIRRMTTEVA